MSGLAQTNHTEKKDFLVRSSSLKDVRTFCREVFEKLHIEQNLKEELVLAIAEAAQNIVKHAYKDNPDTEDKMVVQISCNENKLQRLRRIWQRFFKGRNGRAGPLNSKGYNRSYGVDY